MKNLPGTAIENVFSDPKKTLYSIFASGGLFLSQVCFVTGIELHTVQNWVKRGFVAPPIEKRYSVRQVCRIAIINMLRDVLPLDTALQLLRYINGALDDESDDMIDDSVLYLKFCDMIINNKESKEMVMDIEDLTARTRTEKVLDAMFYAYKSAEYKRLAKEIIENKGEEK